MLCFWAAAVVTAMACSHSSQTGGTAQTARAESPPTPAPQPTPIEGDRVLGEYLVTVQNGGDEPMLRRLFADHSIRSVRQLRDDLFLINIERDPGPEAMRQFAAGCDQIRAVQPNLVYRYKPPPSNLPERVK